MLITCARLFFAYAVCAQLIIATKANAQIVSFNHITQEYGLRNGNVRAIVRDYQGFVWIGTEDGLHRYDGYSMKIYRKVENDSTSMSSNFILRLFEDSNKNLWIGTLDGSLCLYNRKKDNFIRFKKQLSKNDSRIDEAIRAIYEDDNKQLFIGSGRLLRSTLTNNIDSIRFNQVGLPIDTLNNAGIRVMGISEYRDNLLLVSINNVGLFIFDKNTNKFSPHKISQFEKTVQSIYLDKKRGLIWLGTWKNGLIVSDYSGEKYKRIKKGDDVHSLRNDYVPALAADSLGNLWMATDYGLSMITYKCDPLIEPLVETYLPDSKNHSSIQGSIIKSVYVDSDDNLWVGAYYDGLNLYYKHSTHFGTIVLPEENQSAPDSRSVTALVENGAHHLWIGTDGSGLFFSRDSIGKASKVFERITSCKGIEKIKSMKLDGNESLWIGTWGQGLYTFNTQTRTCQNFDSFKTGVDIGKEILSLEVDPVGDVWIGTFDKGFFRFNPKTKTALHVERLKKSSDFIDRVNAIRSGNDNTIWIGKEAGGLNRATLGSDKYEVIETNHIQTSTSVSSIYVDKEDVLWIGCPSKGLVRYDARRNTSVLYTEQDGLGNSVTYGILEDDLGRLWISTDAGISVFDKKNKKFVNLGKSNGLLSNQFNRSSILSTYNGYFAFGSIKGISYINPNLFQIHHHNSPIEFTRLLINNKEQQVDRPGSVLKENISIANEINLGYNQNSFSFEVASLDYDFSHQSDYYYKLEGFDDTWQYAGVQRLIQYTKLNPGTYQLKVTTSQTPDLSRSIASIDIIIHPAWWQTTAFKIAIVLVTLFIAFTVHRLRIRYLLKQKENLEQQVNQRTRRLNATNDLLKTKLGEINTINTTLNQQQDEIIEKNNEIQTQNEELMSQNEHIAEQHEKLVAAQHNLQVINSKLEKTVDERTQTLQETIDHLNKIVFELDRFVYSASHDLSAPLKSILGLVQIINFEKDQTKVTEYVSLIKDTVLKLEAVIKSMVDYARNSHVQVKTEKFNLRELVDEVYTELAYLPEAIKLTFDNLIPEELQVQSDRTRVKVIFNNLITNGIKYADKNKTVGFIKIESHRKGSNTFVKVSDNGIGVRAEYLDKIFNMYFRATEISKGSGLGLFIVKETINKIGGKVSVESTIGLGSTFEITIPEMSH